MFEDLSIRKRLILTTIFITGVALSLAILLLSIYEVRTYFIKIRDNLTVQSRIIAGQSAASLAFDDEADAKTNLNALSYSPEIVYAALYTKDRRIFAKYSRHGMQNDFSPIEFIKEGYYYTFNFISIIQPVILDNEKIGALYIRSSLNELYSTIKWYLIAAFAVIVISLLAAYVMTAKLEGSIIEPVFHLTRLMEAVSTEKNYSLRVTENRNDELGILARGFNEMLSQIENRDAELQMHRQRLEEEVLKRTLELTKTNERLQKELAEREKAEAEQKRLHAQLLHAHKMEAVGQLAGGIAHDFNNMLTAIMGYAGLLKLNMEQDSVLLPYVEQILTSSEKASNLTQQLLAFSRRQIINPKPANLNSILKDIEKLLSRLIREDIELRILPSAVGLTAIVDNVQIEQALINLATNARDAMPNGGMLSIQACATKIDDEFIKMHGYGKPGNYALITVSDTGIGMDDETKKRIFEPFFTTKELGRGTGLGLSIVYGIIKQHDGYIDVYSEKGKGATFKIYLPLVKSWTAEKKAAVTHPPKGGSETILIAEDRNDVREIIKTVLEKFGYTVMIADDGDEAVNKFNEHKDSIDMLIFDVVMPKKSGKEAYDEISKVTPAIKCLFMSGYTADIINKKGILEEGIEFISKPISPDALLKKVREILDK